MKNQRTQFIRSIFVAVLTVLVLNVTNYAQSVTIISDVGPNPVAGVKFTVTAAPTITVEKVVFYRNNVPVHTDETFPYELPQDEVGQETYTYRARAIAVGTDPIDSPDLQIIVRTKRVITMGESALTPVGPNRYYDHSDDIIAALEDLNDPKLPEKDRGGTLFFPCSGGLYPNGDPDPISIYNISKTIVIPSNVTIQGEGSESPEGRCRIYWRDPEWEPDYIDIDPRPADSCYDNDNPKHNPNTADLLHKPMFQVDGNTKGVRFRDLFLYSRSSGPNCYPRSDFDRIANEETTGIAFYGYSGDISDVIVENVSIANFTWGIKATTCVPTILSENGCDESENKIHDVRIRAYRPTANHRQISINSKYAYDWDMQNVNTLIGPGQGGVEIIKSGRPNDYSGENGKLKFLQLSCIGIRGTLEDPVPPADYCVDVSYHGGLYFKQLFHEAMSQTIKVRDIGTAVNSQPIILEDGSADGKFYDDSMQLYLIGNFILAAPEGDTQLQDNSRLEFYGAGVNSKVFDCGDLHFDRTDTVADGNPNNPPGWDDWRMQFTHTERNRSSFYIPIPVNPPTTPASYLPLQDLHLDKPHTVCSEGVDLEPNTSEIGGEFFDSGVLPIEPIVYNPVQIFDSQRCNADGNPDCYNEIRKFLGPDINQNDGADSNGRTLVIRGAISVNQTITLPTGNYRARQIAGIPDVNNTPAQINFAPSTGIPLLRIDAPTYLDGQRTAGVTIRDLKLVQTNNQAGTTGIYIVGGNVPGNNLIVGVLSDLHLSGMTIQGFETGFYAGHNGSHADPMLDSVSLKNMSFINNKHSAQLNSSNGSNWNVINIAMSSNKNLAQGWDEIWGGTTLQNVSCQGTSDFDMENCLRLQVAHVAVSGLKKTQYVKNVITVEPGFQLYGGSSYQSFMTSSLYVRDSNLLTQNSAKKSLNLLGKAFVVSINNKYDHFGVGSSFFEGELSRVTSCNDSGGTFSELKPLAKNNYIGLETPTLTTCGANPVDWEDAVKWGTDGDIPLVGNFYDDFKEDHVVFRPGSTAKFLIRESQGTRMKEYDWGIPNDIPVVGRFYDTTKRSQIGVYRPSTGQWWIIDPFTGISAGWGWGNSEDIPLVGNFFSEGPNPTDQIDEIAVYRPSTKTFYVLSPKTGRFEIYSRNPNDYGTVFQIGDFLNHGNEQVAQYDEGDWQVLDLNTGDTELLQFGEPGDVPVTGQYFTGPCTQLGVWSPTKQEFQVIDPKPACNTNGTGTRHGEVNWGLKYPVPFYGNDDDLPLVMKNKEGLARPTALRRVGADPNFPHFITKHRWWIHDPITPRL